MYFFAFCLNVATAVLLTPAAGPLRCTNGVVKFRSDAPLEVIQATSKRLQGAIDLEQSTFAWSVDNNSFEGFNSPLQREHFNENYIESDKHPKTTFTGKIIEKVDFQQDGTYTVRAKGQFTIHGISQERIIKSTLTLKKGVAHIHSEFTVLLADHDIRIPRIVHQKIAEQIAVTVDADLK